MLCIRTRRGAQVNYDLGVIYSYIICVRDTHAFHSLRAVKPMTASVQCVTLELTARRPQLLIPQFITIIY